MRRTGYTSSSARRATTPLFLLLLASACHAGAAGPAPAGTAVPQSQAEAAAEIATGLHDSTEAWNRGDLDGFLAPYADDAAFVGGTGIVRGRDEIRQRYIRGYWGSGTPENALRFEIIDTRLTGPASAWTVGRYILYDRDTGETTSTGYFSLGLQRMAGGWKIVHDHSSAAPEEGGGS